MNGWAIFGIVMAVIVAILVVLYILGNKLQKKQVAQKEQMMAAAQPVTMLIIDKKIMPMKDANLPKVVMEQTPKKYQKAKLPIVKAKVGPQITSLICDDAIFDDVPTRGEVKAMVSGIYLVSVKSIRGKKQQQTEETGKKKKGFREKLRKQQAEYQKQLTEEIANKKSKEEAKKAKEKEKKDKERAKKITD